LGDFGAEFSKTKTLGAGVRIFNGAVLRLIFAHGRLDASSGNEECGTSLTLKRMLEKQKTWRQALNLQQNCLSGTRVFCCKFSF